jgi:tetratricopeptide (TPR) repeat protein
LRAKRDLGRAILDFDEVIQLNWQVESAYADRGWAWLLKGDARKAIGDFGAVFAKMENKATFAYVLYGRGLSRTHAGDQVGGDADIAAAQTIDRRLVQELAKLGPALLKGDAKKSAADFDDVFERLYDRFALASALYGRGLLRIGWGDPGGGKADIAAAKTIDPKIAEDVVRLRLN